MAFAIALLVIDDLALPVDVSWNEGNDAAQARLCTDCVGVVVLVGEQPSGASQFVEEQACGFCIRDIARGQLEGIGTAYRFGEGMDLGRLAATQGPDRQRFGISLLPWAERCAFTYELWLALEGGTAPVATSFSVRSVQKRRRDERLKRY